MKRQSMFWRLALACSAVALALCLNPLPAMAQLCGNSTTTTVPCAGGEVIFESLVDCNTGAITSSEYCVLGCSCTDNTCTIGTGSGTPCGLAPLPIGCGTGCGGLDHDEHCNGVDDNSDGTVDESCPGNGTGGEGPGGPGGFDGDGFSQSGFSPTGGWQPSSGDGSGDGTGFGIGPQGPSGDGQAPCNDASCICAATSGDPVTVTTGAERLDPLPIVHVAGPWAIPLGFTVYYSGSSRWSGLLDEAGGGQTLPEQNFWGVGWSHSFSEAIAVFDVSHATQSFSFRRAPSVLTFPTSSVCSSLSGYSIVYRDVAGASYEFRTASLNGQDACADLGGSPRQIRLSSARGNPYRLTVTVDTSGHPTGWTLVDLRSGVYTTFRGDGRVSSKYVRTPGGGTLGWTAYYDTSGNLDHVTHGSDSAPGPGVPVGSGHKLCFAHAALNRAENYLSQVSLAPPGVACTGATTSYATFTVPVASGIGNLTQASLRDGRVFGFQYPTVTTSPGHMQVDTLHLATVTVNGNNVLQLSYPPNPNGSTSCHIAYAPPRARVVTDPSGRREFRRKGTSWADSWVCTGGTPGADPSEANNPCSPTAVAVLEDSDYQLTGGSAVGCMYDSDCATGFLCGAAGVCVRFSCQTPATVADPGQPTFVYPDQPTTVHEGCGCSNDATLQWGTVGIGAHPLQRLTKRTSRENYVTTFFNDAQGRVLATCEGEGPSPPPLTTDPASCPSPARFTRYTYDANWPYAVALVERTSLLSGSATLLASTAYTRDGTTGLVTAVVETGYTYTGTGGTVGSMQRCTAYLYDSATAVRTQIDGPRLPNAGACTTMAGGSGAAQDPLTTIALYAISSTPSSGQVNTQSRRSERADSDSGTNRSLVTTWNTYDALGRATSITEADGTPVSVGYDTHDRLSTITVGGVGGLTTTVNYETSGLYRVTSIVRPSGQGNVFTYSTGDPNTLLETTPLRVTRADAPTTVPLSGDYVEDTAFRIAQVSTYRAGGRTVSGTSTEAYRLTQTRDDRQRLATTVDPYLSGTTTYNYNVTTGLLTSIVDPRSRQTIYGYDAYGRVQSVRRDATGVNATYGYTYTNQATRPATVTYPNGQAITYTYDDFGSAVGTSAADLGTTRSVYNNRGELSQRGEADGTITAFTYDRAMRPTRIDYDSTAMPPSFSGDVNLYWDVMHSTFTCPQTGACVNTTGRLAEADTDILDTSNPWKVAYGYDVVGHTTYEGTSIAGVAYNGAYAYDAAGRRTQVTFPLGTGDVEHYTYNLNTGSDATSFPGDAERIVAIDDYLGASPYTSPVLRIEHGADGLATNIWFNENSGVLPAKASITRTQHTDHTLATWTIRFGTNVDDNPFNYAYNADGSLEEINTGFSFNSHFFQYDTLGRLTCDAENYSATACTTSTSGLIGLYGYDASGNRTSDYGGSTGNGSGAHTYSYLSGSNRMSTWTRGGWTASMNESWGTGTAGAFAPGERVMDQRVAANGQAAITRTFAYFPSGRVREVNLTDARTGTTRVDYGYDHRGRRVYGIYQTGIGGASPTRTDRLFFYDPEDRLIAVYENPITPTGQSTHQELYYWNETEPLFRYVLANGSAELGREFFYNDQVGNPYYLMQVNSSFGAPTSGYQAPLDPFNANAPRTSDPNPMRLRFPGQWVDDGTAPFGTASALLDPQMVELDSNQARVYEPGLGAYSAADPMLIRSVGESRGTLMYSLVEGQSPYAYAGGSPNILVDPTGTTCLDYQPPPGPRHDPHDGGPPGVNDSRCRCFCKPNNSPNGIAKDPEACARRCGGWEWYDRCTPLS